MHPQLSPPIEKPSDVSTVGALLLAGGIVSILWGLAIFVFTCGIWFPGYTYGIGAGVYSIINGSQLLTEDCYGKGVPKTAAILEICQVINFDIFGMSAGIAALILMNNPDVQAYLNGYATAQTSRFESAAQQSNYGVAPGYSAPAEQPALSPPASSADLAGRKTLVENIEDPWSMPGALPGQQGAAHAGASKPAAKPANANYTPGLGSATMAEPQPPETPDAELPDWALDAPDWEAPAWEAPAWNPSPAKSQPPAQEAPPASPEPGWEPPPVSQPSPTDNSSPWGSTPLKGSGWDTEALDSEKVAWAGGSTWKATQPLEDNAPAASSGYKVADWTDWNKAPVIPEEPQPEAEPAEVGASSSRTRKS